jgi:hypothetical protein
MSSGIARRLGRCIALVLAGLVVVAGASAAPASAAIGTMTARLYLKDEGGGKTGLYVLGRVTMIQAEAVGLLNSGHRIVVRVWDDDPVSDDLLLGPFLLPRVNPAAIQQRYVAAAPREGPIPSGLKYYMRLPSVTYEQLDGDPCNPDCQVEIYAGVRLVKSNGTTIRSRETSPRWIWPQTPLVPRSRPIRESFP